MTIRDQKQRGIAVTVAACFLCRLDETFDFSRRQMPTRADINVLGFA
jgi:hypothetical protein